MPKNSSDRFEWYLYTQNRELSWLRFNERVLEEAGDRSNPLLERLKFVAIFSSNLDEFFRVRVGALLDSAMFYPQKIDKRSGFTAYEQLRKIYGQIPELIQRKRLIYKQILSELARYTMKDLPFSSLTSLEQEGVKRWFQNYVSPMLHPMIVRKGDPAPFFINQSLYTAALLKGENGETAMGFAEIPKTLPSYFRISEKEVRFIRVENVVSKWAFALFPSFRIVDVCTIRVTRSAHLFLGAEAPDDGTSFPERIEKLLNVRETLSPVRLEIDRKISDAWMEQLMHLVSVQRQQVFVDHSPLKMNYFYRLADEFPEKKRNRLTFAKYEPRWPKEISRQKSIIEQVQQRDRLLFYPFDSVDPFLDLLSEAASRSDVVSIQITVYRLAPSSKIVDALCRAARNGKRVRALMELRARFDEENNIRYAKMLEEAGCEVIYGFRDMKCHSKICLITLKDHGIVRYLTQIGTGNYNERTNRVYVDLSLLTASQRIGEDGEAFFENMAMENSDGKYKELLVSPRQMKSALFSLIDEETKKGSLGYICIKVNSVAERDLIDKLKEASQAGVEVQLIVRGICCILPGVPTYTDNISVVSIVGRFLEHARIYCFGRGEAAKIYISSADLMGRNLNRRVEIACPIHDPALQKQLKCILRCQLEDYVKGRWLQPDGSYRKKGKRESLFKKSSQSQFMMQPLQTKGAFQSDKKDGKRRLQKFLKLRQR